MTTPLTAASSIVVIGASAGGIDALSTLLSGLPPDFPAPIVIVQHRAAEGGSRLVDVLARFSHLPVTQAVDGESMKPGIVYLARSDLHIAVTDDGRLVY